jgi:hypothetical protein
MMLQIIPRIRLVIEPGGSVENRANQPCASPGAMTTASQQSTYKTTRVDEMPHPSATTLNFKCSDGIVIIPVSSCLP